MPPPPQGVDPRFRVEDPAYRQAPDLLKGWAGGVHVCFFFFFFFFFIWKEGCRWSAMAGLRRHKATGSLLPVLLEQHSLHS